MRNPMICEPSATVRFGRGILAFAAPILPAIAQAEEKPIAFVGRVVEKESGRPIAGASLSLLRMGVDREETMRTDAEGRFEVALPPEDRAEIRLRVDHPGYIRRISNVFPIKTLIDDKKLGGKPFFEAVELEQGIEYGGQVVRPDGSPAAGVAFSFETWSRSNANRSFWDDPKGRTDGRGRFSLRMPKTRSLTVELTPDDLAPFQHFWGTQDPEKKPDEWAPTDLGRLILEPGVTLPGHVVDKDGKPAANIRVEAIGRINRFRRKAVSDAAGRFQFPAMKPGSYTVQAEGQGASFNSVEQVRPETKLILGPVKVSFRRGPAPPPVELCEVPTATVTARFIDSQGRPAVGMPVTLSGRVPDAVPPPDGQPVDEPVKKASQKNGEGLASINEDEAEDPSTELWWGVQLEPGADGRVTFQAPRGLSDADLIAWTRDAAVSLRTRVRDGAPLRFWGSVELGNLEVDPPVSSFVVYRAPSVVVNVVMEEGDLPDDLEVGEHFVLNGGGHGGRFLKLGDGRFRSQSLMPDHDYEIRADARGYVSATTPRVQFPEGGTAEFTLILRREPEVAKAGDLAPPILLRGLDGEPLTLADFAGKYVLVAFYSSGRGRHEDIPTLKAIRKRFGGDGRFAQVGLSFDFQPDDAARFAKANGIDWPQAVMGQQFHALRAAYIGKGNLSTAVLIGPDLRIVAAGLKGPAIEAAVAKALGGD